MELTPRPINDDTPRRISEIDPGLRQVLRGLVSGQLPWPMFLTGDPGRGKSAAVLALADYVRGAVYYRLTQLLRAFESARAGSVEVEFWAYPESRFLTEEEKSRSDAKPTRKNMVYNLRDFWRYLANAPLLILDDIATRSGYTDAQYDQVYELIDERKRKPLIVVSNLSLVDLGKVFDDRIVSRLAAGSVFTLKGRDRRLEGKR